MLSSSIYLKTGILAHSLTTHDDSLYTQETDNMTITTLASPSALSADDTARIDLIQSTELHIVLNDTQRYNGEFSFGYIFIANDTHYSVLDVATTKGYVLPNNQYILVSTFECDKDAVKDCIDGFVTCNVNATPAQVSTGKMPTMDIDTLLTSQSLKAYTNLAADVETCEKSTNGMLANVISMNLVTLLNDDHVESERHEQIQTPVVHDDSI